MMSQATTSPVQSSNYNSNMGESNSSLPRQPKVSYFLSLEGDEVETPAMERTHNNSSELAQSTEEELHLSAADVDRSQEQDRFNLSRDDSDIGGEYFLRGLAVTGSPAPAAAAAAALSSSPAYSASPSSVWEGSAALMGTDTHFAAYLRTARSPPRVMSSHSLLLGEDILVTTHSSSGHQQQQHGSPLEEQQQQCPFIIEEELFTSSYLNTPFLPQFRGEGDFGSVSTNSSPLAEAEEDNVMFTPNHLILSPGTQVTTPPSALFPPSLSPPLLINDDLRSNHGIRFNGGDGSGVEYSQHQLKQQQHEQYRQQDGSQASPFSKPLRKRPPRAPSNLTLRSFQPLGIPPASHTSNNSNINAGINRSIIAFNNRSNNGFDHHIRVQSNGDESLLSALTDSDCEGTGFYGMVGGGGRPVARVVSSSTSCGAIAVPRQRHSSSSSLPNLAWTSDGVVAQQQQQERKDVPGMNIDIPSSLQQPVLGDEDEDEDGHSTGHVDDSNDDERNSGKQCRDDRRVAAEVSSLQDFQSPVIQQRKDKGCAEDDICEKDLLNDHQPDEDKLGSLREFEAEAEIALLAAIEEMRNKSTGDGVRKNAHLKPYNSPEEDSERSSNTVRSSETTLDENETKAAENQTSAVTQWLALQNADEDVVASLVLREEELKNYFQLGAVDMLVNNAQILLSATKNGRTSCNATTMSSQISRSDTRKKYDATLTQEEDAADKGDNAMEDAEARRKEAAPLIDTAAHMPQLLKAHFDRYMRQIKEDWVVFDWCSHLQKGKVESYITNLLTFIIIPSLGLASLLFVLDNPKIGEGPTSRDQTEAIENEMASLSWRVIFFGVRHPLVWSLARGAEYFFIKFFCHEKSGFFILVGPEAGVSFVQSRGWPCVLFFYGVFSLGLLYGKSDFAKHWLYW